uniref:Thioredoxin domain-containing protein n=1 Tax=Caenorhabditis japonica TaxID=281687 RepID=A0A8R1HL25_CAEJA
MVQIAAGNHDEVLQNSRLTFVSFTAAWCPFSRQLLTNYKEAAIEYKQKYPEKKTIWGNVDCMENEPLCEKYGIMKYPTMKVFFYGNLMAEYRGGRQADTLIEYVQKMENTTGLVHLKEAESITQWQEHVVPQKGTLILWFPRNSPPFDLILKAIALIHDRLTVIVPAEQNSLEHEQHKLWFSMDGKKVEEFNGSVTNFKEILVWVRSKSAGMVRELTFENAEEMVEEQIPMLLLFRKKGDVEVERKFVEAVRRELDDTTRAAINPLMTDSNTMVHVLSHLNRKPEQGPFLVIDQFVHTFPSPWEGDEIFAEGNIKKVCFVFV